MAAGIERKSNKKNSNLYLIQEDFEVKLKTDEPYIPQDVLLKITLILE